MRKYNITESRLRNMIRESVRRALNEVTDYGNNIFGSANLNPSSKEKYGVDSDDYYAIRHLIHDIIEKFGDKRDFIQNYAKDSVCAYLWGDIEERRGTCDEIKRYCESAGFLAKFSEDEDIGYGNNRTPLIKISFERL